MSLSLYEHQDIPPILDSLVEFLGPVRFCVFLVVYIVCAGLVELSFYSHVQSVVFNGLWFERLATNLLLYGLIYLPIWALQRLAPSLLKRWECDTGVLASRCRRYLTLCFLKHLPDDCLPFDQPAPRPKPVLARFSDAAAAFIKKHRWLTLFGCAVGLNLVYVMWGILQEKLMTKDYGGECFADPQFLVFCNRLGALFVSSTCIFLIHGCGKRSHSADAVTDIAPLSGYASPALSNILSSWCQYEALLFITFPVQVISKSCKTIPVMLMGRCLYGRSYKAFEYITTGLIGVGVSTFILSSPPNRSSAVTTSSLSGLLLLCGYIALDSYTSTSQDNLFRTYNMSPLHMMRGVSGWAVVFTVAPLLINRTLAASLQFALAHPTFVVDVGGSAVCSGFGQILIFLTIAEFGAVTFTIIMTIRQCLSILASCLIFGHPINAVGFVGLFITFGAILLRIFWKRLFSTQKA
uniref:Adenosine 3'-phospho 5'-phosphosulfate transporter 1 n=2 Tax=Mesocestoides corti TaxID=53468 RepID=A0A5K3FCH2_MESCO